MSKLPKAKYSKYYYKELSNASESELWKWYWKVKFEPSLFKQKKSTIWRYYDFNFKNEKFINNKSEEREFKNIYQK